MQRKINSFLFCSTLIGVICSNGLKAQSIENSINLYGSNFPQEKIHIHFDKEVYLPGETIWFKAYLFEENLPSERSTNFYAALYDEDGKLIQEQLSPIFNSTTDGHFDIPDSLTAKQLICRAYTSWMMNFDTTLFFTKTIRLINKNGKDENAVKAVVSLQFFPEGGDIIEGTKNTVAFKANYNNGLPFEINGVIKKQETGEVMMPFNSLHDGMGRFDIEIQPNEKLFAEWTDNNGATQQTYLPKAKPEGVSLKLVLQKDRLVYNIVNKLPGDSLHVLMYMYQRTFYKTNLSVSAALPYTGMVPVNSLPTGVMQLTIFNAAWKPVAERVAFINNNNYELGAAITNKETSTQKRGKNLIEVEVADTIPANMSLSITDADLNNEETNSTIVTNLLLSGNVKGYIHNPVYYFTSDTDDALKAKLDLVMLTHGWRRYNWDNMLVLKTPVIYYPADNYLSAYGQISKEVMAKITAEENVNLIVKTKDSTNNFYALTPDNNGLLKQNGLIFYDTARVLFSFNKNKIWNRQMAFSTSNYTYHQPQLINNYRDYFIRDTAGYVKFSSTASLFNYYNTNKANQPFNKEKTLQGVIVKSSKYNWKNDPVYKMDEKYTSGSFRGGATSEAFDVMHDETADDSRDVLTYIKYRSNTLLRGRGTGTLYFIDEHFADISEVEMLWMTNIAYIKIIYPYFSTRNEGGNLGVAISIYTKKGDDAIDRRPKDTDLQQVKIMGYSPIKEFYSPDYSQSNTNMGTDARTTLLWLPYIITDAANRKIPIPFYNNDLTKRMRIVLEGINEEGKMIHIEKIIE
ncbi:MAG: hypothetical protein ABI666_00185 [Ferruginibacter sp.]